MICGNVLVGVLSNEQIRVPSINIDIGDRQHSKLTALHNDRAVAVYNLSDRTISGNYSHSVLSLPQVTFFPNWADNDLFINWTGHSAIIKLTKRKVPNTTTCTEPRHNQVHVWHHTRNSDLKCWCKRYTLQLLWQKCKLHHREIELGWTLTPICRKIWQEHFPLLLQILKKGRVHPQSECISCCLGRRWKGRGRGDLIGLGVIDAAMAGVKGAPVTAFVGLEETVATVGDWAGFLVIGHIFVLVLKMLHPYLLDLQTRGWLESHKHEQLPSEIESGCRWIWIPVQTWQVSRVESWCPTERKPAGKGGGLLRSGWLMSGRVDGWIMVERWWIVRCCDCTVLFCSWHFCRWRMRQFRLCITERWDVKVKTKVMGSKTHFADFCTADENLLYINWRDQGRSNDDEVDVASLPHFAVW